jgi:hypothetical protein
MEDRCLTSDASSGTALSMYAMAACRCYVIGDMDQAQRLSSALQLGTRRIVHRVLQRTNLALGRAVVREGHVKDMSQSEMTQERQGMRVVQLMLCPLAVLPPAERCSKGFSSGRCD